MVSIPVGTRNTAAQVHGIGWVYKLRYCTCTHKTHDLKPMGFPVPVASPRKVEQWKVLTDKFEDAQMRKHDWSYDMDYMPFYRLSDL